MKNTTLSLFLIVLTILTASAQNQFTPYDELPGIDIIYKPAFDSSFTGWKKMLYEYPVNFIEIEKDYYATTHLKGKEKSAIIRYYKIWKRAVEPYTNAKGEIILPDLQQTYRNLTQAQHRAVLVEKSTAIGASDWTFLGPKETFWLNETNLNENRYDENDLPEQCPWQANVYSFDIANSNNAILYCGTETGYVNKSTDMGSTWEQLGKHYPFGGGVPAIAIHPENADIVYVSAGNQMHKTTNGGATWTPLLPVNNRFGAVRLRINPDNPEQIIAAAGNGFYLSNDAGNTWSKKWSNAVWDVEFQPGKPTYIYALSKNNSGKFQIIVSENGGDSFQIDANFPASYTETSGGLLAVTPANPNIVYATLLTTEGSESVPFILKGTKTESGLSWTETKKGEYFSVGGLGGFTNGQGYFDLVLEVAPDNENIVFWGTCTLFKSTNGAKDFTKVGGYGGEFPIHPDIQDMKILPNGITWVATDGGMNLSTDHFTAYENYSSRTKGILGSDMWGFDQGWNDDIVVGGRYHNGNTALSDTYGNKALRMGGGESATGWVLQGKSRHVAFNDLGNGWILPETAEGQPQGRFIFSKYPNMDEYGGRRSNLVHHPNYYGTIYLGEGNGFWKSSDMGESFDLLHQFPDKVRYLQISSKNPDVFYADVVAQGLYRSEDGGKTWVHKPALTDGRVGDSSWNGKLFFAISPYDENKIYVCLQNGTWSSDIGKIYYSENGGTLWKDYTDGLSEYTKCLVVQPTSDGKDLVYLFTTSKNGVPSKVYSRIEGQPSWRPFDNNYPAGFSVNLALPFFRDGKLRVAGNGGVWETPMAEPTFAPLVNPWIEKKAYNCMEDTLYFDDHSQLNHAGAEWEWEITPSPEYISNSKSRNPKVVLGNPGTYDVTLTVHQAGESYSKTIVGMVNTTSCPSVDDCGNPAEIDKSNWTLAYVDSEEKTGEDGKATNAFDGDPESFWHSEWYLGQPAQPHELQIDMGKEYLLSSFNYLPRQSSSNGRIKAYEFYVSPDGQNWGTPVSKGNFDGGAGAKKIVFAAKSGRFIKLKSLSEQSGAYYTTVAEISVTGCVQKDATLANQLIQGEISAYPIPANDKITVELPPQFTKEKWNYKIISSAGQILQSNEVNNSSFEHTFDLNGTNPGMYFIVLQDSSSKVYRVKIIVN